MIAAGKEESAATASVEKEFLKLEICQANLESSESSETQSLGST